MADQRRCCSLSLANAGNTTAKVKDGYTVPMSHGKRKDWVLMQRTQKHKHSRTGQTMSNVWLIVPSSLCSVVCVAVVIGMLFFSFRRQRLES